MTVFVNTAIPTQLQTLVLSAAVVILQLLEVMVQWLKYFYRSKYVLYRE